MDLEALALNLRRLRTAKGFSQKRLAEAAGISLPTVKNLETGRTEPRVATLEAAAEALEVGLQDLLRPVRYLETVRFRSARRMRNRENILADVSRWLDEFGSIEKILGEEIEFRLKKVAKSRSPRVPVRSAKACRKTLGLEPNEPIHDICGLLEAAGVKVYSISSASDEFFGLSVAEKDGGPAVAVNVWDRISVERRIFSAAHELGHLVLHAEAYDVNETGENPEEEREADLFAGHFLMPDEGFTNEWNEAAGLHWVDRVLKVKRIFHVSYKTVLFRLKEHGVADDTVWRRFHQAYQRRYNRRLAFRDEPSALRSAEPHALDRFEFYQDRLCRLVRMAIEEGKISLGRGAEILRMGTEEMQDLLRNWGSVL